MTSSNQILSIGSLKEDESCSVKDCSPEEADQVLSIPNKLKDERLENPQRDKMAKAEVLKS